MAGFTPLCQQSLQLPLSISLDLWHLFSPNQHSCSSSPLASSTSSLVVFALTVSNFSSPVPLIHQLASCIFHTQNISPTSGSPSLLLRIFHGSFSRISHTILNLLLLTSHKYRMNLPYLQTIHLLPHLLQLLSSRSRGSPSAPCSRMPPSISRTSLSVPPSFRSSEQSHPRTTSHSSNHFSHSP